MNHLSLILCLTAALFVAPAMAQESSPSKIIFTNQDELTGSLDGITTDSAVWNSPLLGRSTPFLLDAVREIRLNALPATLDASHQATVSLTNGDQLNGKLITIAPTSVELETAFGGRLTLNRLMIADVKISEQHEHLYRGPNGLEGWEQSAEKPNWTYANGSLQATGAGGIARNIDLPLECRISFDVKWKGILGLKLNFASSDISTDRPESGYELAFRQQTVSVRNAKTRKILGYTRNAAALQENENARIEVRFSAKSGKLALFVDEEIVEIWTDADLERNQGGKGFHLVAVQDSPVQISKIEIAAWDPEVSPLPDPEAAIANQGFPMDEDAEVEKALEKPAPKSDRIELRNGDSLVGEVLGIQGESITIKTPFRDVTLPIEALRSIYLPPVSLERCKRENGDIRIWASDGSSLVFRLLSLKDGLLSGRSQNFGEGTFKLNAIQRIEFNIYPRNSNELPRDRELE
jgi:hypothetical protein